MIGVVIGTGPSLSESAPMVRELGKKGAFLIGVNNTYQDFEIDAWIACDPKWHRHYGHVSGPFEKWHWDKSICEQNFYQYVEGVWYGPPGFDSGWLWLQDKTKISLNHGSGPQALNLAVHYGCDPILLVGHDFHYRGWQRHYFTGLSDVAGEYPEPLRKFSLFDKGGKMDDMLSLYKRIADQEGRPNIINVTPGSALPWFPMGNLEDYV